jgi:hypothetical protein
LKRRVLSLGSAATDFTMFGFDLIGAIMEKPIQGAHGKGVTMAKSLRSQLYRAARDLGNVQAAAKGPSAYGRRVVRRKTYAKTNGALSKILKSLLK